MPEPADPGSPADSPREEGTAARRWRARREREHRGDGLADGQERLDGNPYLDGLKYACMAFAGFGLVACLASRVAGLFLWALAGLCLVGWLVVGALLWQPPSAPHPPE
jgi:hypothetical protein